MFLLMFFLRYVMEQPLLCFGTLFLSVYGIILSSISLVYKKSSIVQVSRIMLCLVIPFTNFSMYLSSFDGNAADGFRFVPFNTVDKLTFIFQILFILLPELFWILSLKINTKHYRFLPWLYPIGFIAVFIILSNYQ